MIERGNEARARTSGKVVSGKRKASGKVESGERKASGKVESGSCSSSPLDLFSTRSLRRLLITNAKNRLGGLGKGN